MSLRKQNITDLKKISFRGANKKFTIIGKAGDDHSINSNPNKRTKEEESLAYLLERNVNLAQLVNRFNLVSEKTNEPINFIVKKEDQVKEVVIKTPEVKTDKQKLEELALEILRGESIYKAEAIIKRIKLKYNITEARAEKGFKKMVELEILTERNRGGFYLTTAPPY